MSGLCRIDLFGHSRGELHVPSFFVSLAIRLPLCLLRLAPIHPPVDGPRARFVIFYDNATYRNGSHQAAPGDNATPWDLPFPRLEAIDVEESWKRPAFFQWL